MRLKKHWVFLKEIQCIGNIGIVLIRIDYVVNYIYVSHIIQNNGMDGCGCLSFTSRITAIHHHCIRIIQVMMRIRCSTHLDLCDSYVLETKLSYYDSNIIYSNLLTGFASIHKIRNYFSRWMTKHSYFIIQLINTYVLFVTLVIFLTNKNF